MIIFTLFITTDQTACSNRSTFLYDAYEPLVHISFQLLSNFSPPFGWRKNEGKLPLNSGIMRFN